MNHIKGDLNLLVHPDDVDFSGEDTTITIETLAKYTSAIDLNDNIQIRYDLIPNDGKFHEFKFEYCNRYYIVYVDQVKVYDSRTLPKRGIL